MGVAAQVYDVWLQVIGLLWQSPSLARHLAAIVTLHTLISSKVERKGTEPGPAINSKCVLRRNLLSSLGTRRGVTVMNWLRIGPLGFGSCVAPLTLSASRFPTV
jgi:hypothetical protein